MVKVEPFAVEQWMDAYENTPGVLNVAETCCASVSINDLLQLSSDGDTQSPILPDIKLTYGAIRGSKLLRERIAALCSAEGSDPLGAEDVVAFSGAISANFVLMYTLLGPGDHVICVYPTYQQLYSVPKSLGAEVSLWKLNQENGFIPDIEQLEYMVKDNTKMIIINNPNNPSGVPIPTETLQSIVDFAKRRNILLFSDEVYRPLFHRDLQSNISPPRPAVTYGYENTIVSGSMSKAFALAGIRVGWVASRNKTVIEAILAARDYTTISVSSLDDQVAAFALSPNVQKPLLERNIALAQRNRRILASFMQKHHSVCSWTEPSAGTTAFIQFAKAGAPVKDAAEFCRDVLNKTKVLMVPGSHCFGQGTDFRGFVRIGYVCETHILETALERLSQYLIEHDFISL